MWKRFRNTNYEVNKEGVIRHIKKKTIRKPYKGEYLRITLYENNKQFTISIHEIVAELYLDKPDYYECINHKDGNKYNNNNKDNLEYCTFKENINHAINKGLIKPTNRRGGGNGRSILNKKQVLKIREIKPLYSYKQLAEMYGVHKNTIKDIIARRNWSHI